MKKVKLIGPGLKLNNSWHWCGEEVVISDEEYEKNKNYLNVLEDLENEIVPNNEEDKDTNDNSNNDLVDKQENDEESSDDEELEILREKAKELGISNCGRMKKETLIEKIAEKENEEITEE